jgi:hypothetical protein
MTKTTAWMIHADKPQCVKELRTTLRVSLHETGPQIPRSVTSKVEETSFAQTRLVVNLRICRDPGPSLASARGTYQLKRSLHQMFHGVSILARIR